MGAVEYVGETDTIRIVTETRDGRELITPIWGVVVDGVPYIRNGYGEKSKWYARAWRSGRVAFADGSARYPATIERVDDATELDRVDTAYTAKYRGQEPGVTDVNAPAVRAYTLRVIPV
ncbi:DUF2255 family protein [Herbiconiux ginsengi]|uniref:DUF2255 family protein n=1 Tax=Herbiconiux ginsengi TaxID=381665 RepID=A0A1H3RKK0_9MICO|nr:DUF2255 family protein [Herbiconiux ginsengi]SDZ25429.1 hypothetical protein SAMN05216554_2835 [Herbiconiux ginsengi]